MPGAIPPLPQYVFTTWCLVKHRDNFTFIHYIHDYCPHMEVLSSIRNPRTGNAVVIGPRVTWVSDSNDSDLYSEVHMNIIRDIDDLDFSYSQTIDAN
jgi:hypothetical protein